VRVQAVERRCGRARWSKTPEDGTLDVAAAWNKAASRSAEKTAERERNPEGGT
jgi:hypothetical protein